jgi:hypothetical protein
MTNENERESVDDKCIGSQRQRKELKKGVKRRKVKFHSNKAAAREVGVHVARTP